MGELPLLTIKQKDLPSGNVLNKYSPPNWNNTGQRQLYAITFKSAGADTQALSPATILRVANPSDVTPQAPETNSPFVLRANSGKGPGYNSTTLMSMFIFDAIKRAHHSQSARVTQHPLQTGFNISDHVVMQPSTLSLEVGMSDALAEYTVAGYTPMWDTNPSRSVSAYQTMLGLMSSRQLMNINTRLQTYFNMVLTEISVEDTIRSYFGGLTMVLQFQQVFISDISVGYMGARIQSSDETTQGTVQPQPPSKPVEAQHKITTWFTPAAPILTVPDIFPGIPGGTASDIANWIARGFHVPGAGTWFSNVMTGKAPGPIPNL